MGKIKTLVTTITVLLAVVTPAFAETARNLETKATVQTARETNLKSRADAEINRRITALQEGITKIQRLKKLTADQKATFASQLQAEVTSLTDLKAKIDADTDIATLRTDVHSIVKSFRVYAIYLPKMRILVAADSLSATADILSVFAEKLQIRIANEKSAGKDTASLETALTDVNTKITDAKNQASSTQSTVLALTPDGYPANLTILQQVRNSIQTGRKDLLAAYQTAKTIMKTLESTERISASTASGSATPALQK